MPTPTAGEEVVVMQTNKGQIVIGFRPDKAPNHVANFKKLLEGFFKEWISKSFTQEVGAKDEGSIHYFYVAEWVWVKRT